MSGVMHKIADALTGHHNTNTNAANTNATGLNNNTTGLNNNTTGMQQPLGNQAGGVGTGLASTNYSAAENGALKEGAQVRDTGLNAAKSHTAAFDSYDHNKTGTGSHLGRDAALGAGALGAAGAAATHHHHHTGSNSSLSSSNMGSTGSALGTSSGMGMGAASTTQTNTMNRSTVGATGVGAGVGQVGYEDGSMTRSEEHLLVGKEKVNVGQAVLNKYVTTEKVSTAVPIIREHAVVEREPITDVNRAGVIGGDFKEARYEVNLMEERAVAEKEVVPIERVRLRKEVEQTQQYVEAELRKEHIELVDSTQNAALGGKQLGAGVGMNTTTSATTSATGLGRNSRGNSLDNTSNAARNL